MPDSRRCPQCGAELPADAVEGVCPKCLLQMGFGSAAGSQEGVEPGATSPHGSRFVPPQPSELAGHFPQFEIVELLGAGGMGAVYKARQIALDRLVALKILPPEVGRDPAFAERFTREARSMARLSHQNIVNIYDFGQVAWPSPPPPEKGTGDEGTLYYLVMEFVDGPNLRQVLRCGELKPPEALAIVPQICDALQYAHEEGVVHRDVKPENVLLDRKGRVKIADFGLAKLLGRAPAELTLTGTGQVMGTLHYMAPEQMERPLEVDHRADIYSLGVVFYEMLTGELPIGRFAPPSRRVQVDVRLDEVVLKTLEKEPQRRYQHASEVKTDLESISSSKASGRKRSEGSAEAGVGHTPAEAGASAGKANTLPAGLGTRMLSLAIMMVFATLVIATGAVMGVVAVLSVGPESPAFWGWMGGTFGCIIGGAGALIGTWNSYRQLEGAGDLMAAAHWTWLDSGMVGYGLLGGLALGGGLMWPLWRSGAAAYWLRLVGGIVVFQAALTLLIRALLRRAARQEEVAERPPASPTQRPSAEARDAGPSRARFSRKAIVGATWAALFFVLLLPSVMVTQEVQVQAGAPQEPDGPQWWQWLMMFTLLPLGAAAPFGTTILGMVSVSEIRHSRGRLIGLPLALADALLFPLLVLDVLICCACYFPIATNRFLDEFSTVAVIVGLLISAAVDFLIVMWAWRRVAGTERPTRPHEGPSGEPGEQGLQRAGNLVSDHAARAEVKGPAIGMLVAGTINWLAPVVFLLTTAAELRRFGAWRIDQQVAVIAAHAAILSTGLIFGGLLMVSALRMMRLGGYRSAVTGSILAMVIPPGCLIGLPIGIWSLVVLSRAEVKQAFADGHSPNWRLQGALGALTWTLLVSLVAILFHAGFWPYDHLAPASYTITDTAVLEPRSEAYRQIIATASGSGRTLGYIARSDSLPRQRLTLSLFEKSELGSLEINLPTLGYRYRTRDGFEVAESSGLNEDVLLEWLESAEDDGGEEPWERVADRLLRFAERAADGQRTDLTGLTFFSSSRRYAIEPSVTSDQRLSFLLRRDPANASFASGEMQIDLDTLGYRYRDREGAEVVSDSGLDEEALVEWLNAAGVEPASPQVRTEAAMLLDIARDAARQPIEEACGPVGFAVRSSFQEREVVVDPWVVPAVCAFWLVIWPGGCTALVFRARSRTIRDTHRTAKASGTA